FFITEAPYPSLNGHYSLFGQCQDFDVVKKIARMPTDPRTDRPYDPPKIIRIKIIDPRHPVAKPGTTMHKPATAKPATPPSQ
ncbi:MAG: peptidylprolyl isomerase, partial [Candidatus Korobacteraceae bacterium]